MSRTIRYGVLALLLTTPVYAQLPVQTLYRVDSIRASTPACTEHCNRVDAQWPVFEGDWRWVNPLLERQLTASVKTVAPLATYYQQALRTDGEQGHDITDRVLVKEWTDRWLVLEMRQYVYPERAAHGMEDRTWLTFDHSTKTLLQLDDLLQPGQQQALKGLLYQQYQKNIENLQLFDHIAEQDFADFSGWWLDQWGTLHVLYSPYAIAPYSSGHPELQLSAEALQGILRPQWLSR